MLLLSDTILFVKMHFKVKNKEVELDYIRT